MSAIQQMMIGCGRGGTTLMSALTAASLTTNLKLCLDAGDASSYDPAIQTDKWLDVAGAGYDFYRGSGTGGDAADPTFTGAKGSLESYWAFDGGDYFTYDTTNEAWMETLHKNAAIYSLVALIYSNNGYNVAISTATGASDTGISVFLGDSTRLRVLNAGASALDKLGGALSDGYHMVGLSINENGGAAGGFFYLDGGYNQVGGADTWNPNYGSPSAGSASVAMKIATSEGIPNASGERLAGLAVWQGTALTKANMDTIWNAMRGRFGI